MGTIHDLILQHGRDEAKRIAGAESHSLVDLAASVLADENQGMGVTYSGFCLTSLPHKKLQNDQRWVREQGRVSLLVEPGFERRRDGTFSAVGVPFGAKARLILIYLQTEALKNRSREVELGRSMNCWLDKLGIEAGGSTYKAVSDQANRISLCRLTFYWAGEHGDTGFQKENIVSSGIHLKSSDSIQDSFWRSSVLLSDTFYSALTKHPVPVLETAIKNLSSSSMAIDVYVWLAYRLHVLTKSQTVSWPSLFSQFGAGYQHLWAFKPKFKPVLDLALAVYPEAIVTSSDDGVILHPSPPPIPERALNALVR